MFVGVSDDDVDIEPENEAENVCDIDSVSFENDTNIERDKE